MTSSTATPTTYRCGTCGTTTTAPAGDDLPMCSAGCGLLFDDEIVTEPAPSKRATKFRCDGREYAAGDDRSYDVLVHGRMIGVCEPGFGFEGGRVFEFSTTDGARRGSGRTRYAAVADAYGA